MAVCVLFISSAFSGVMQSAGAGVGDVWNDSSVYRSGGVAETLGSNGIEVFSMTTREDITVLLNGDSDLTISTMVPSSPLAEMYRIGMGAPSNASIGETMPIPEMMTLLGTINISQEVAVGDVNVSKMDIPVRQQFYEAMFQEQLFLLGFLINPVDSQMMPKGSENEIRFSLNAYVAEFAKNIEDMPSSLWEINVGPVDENATSLATGHLLAQMEVMQGFLESLADEQAYHYEWDIAIKLPVDAILLNEDELLGLGWKILFGGGSFMEASVSLDGETVIINHLMVVGESDFTVTPEELFQALLNYRVFKIEYELNSGKSSLNLSQPTSNMIRTNNFNTTDWSYSWSNTISPGSYSMNFGGGTVNAGVTVTPSLTVAGHIGWESDFSVWEGFYLESFEAWMEIEASITVRITASASSSYSHTWDKSLFEWKVARFTFMVGIVPGWADLEFSGILQLEFSARGELTFIATASASAWFRYGVEWTDDDGWDTIQRGGVKPCTLNGPAITAEANAVLRPSLKLRLQLLFYSAAGPFVEFEPYAECTVSFKLLPPSTWKIEVGTSINAGVTFAGTLERILGLEDYDFTIYEWVWETWSGTITPPPPNPPPKKYNLTIKTKISSFGDTYPMVGTYNYVGGTVLNVTAFPKAGYKFGGWILDGVDIGTANPRNISIIKDCVLTAVFTSSLEIKIEPNGIGGKTTPVAGTYWRNANTQQIVTAHPHKKSGSTFEKWILDGNDEGSNDQITVPMNGHHTLIAFFNYVPLHDIGINKSYCYELKTSGVLDDTPNITHVFRGEKVGVNAHVANYGTDSESYTVSVKFNEAIVATLPPASTEYTIDSDKTDLKMLTIDTTPLDPGEYNVNMTITMTSNVDTKTNNNSYKAGIVVIMERGINLTIISPLDRYVYLFGIPFMPFPLDYHPEVHVAVLLGPVLIKAIAESGIGIEKVGFSIDNGTIHWDYNPPWLYFWFPPLGIGLHTITVIAYDKAGYSTSRSMQVISFWILPSPE